MPDRTNLTASIVVCTRNRSVDLETTCRALLDLTSKSDLYEIVVVDNGSIDETASVTTRLSKQYPDRFRSVYESQSGLSAARNRGISSTKGEFVVFVDDDAIPTEAWLEGLTSELQTPSVWAVGGPVSPSIAASYPPWFSARFLPYLSAWELGEKGLDLRYNEYPRGTNIAFKRSVFDRLGMFLPELGRRGRSLRSCEEIELCLRIERAGGRIRYAPAARVSHKVDISRLTEEWMIRRFTAQGFSEAIMEWYHAGMEGAQAGIHRGWRQIRQTRSKVSTTDRLMGKCFVGALRGYLFGSLFAATRVGRYRPPDSGLVLHPWSPPG